MHGDSGKKQSAFLPEIMFKNYPDKMSDQNRILSGILKFDWTFALLYIDLTRVVPLLCKTLRYVACVTLL